VHVDDHVWIGLNGLVKLIDQLGRVTVVVTNPVMDDFYPSDLNSGSYPYDYYRVDVLPGAKHLDGVRALQYAAPAG
jgi:anionic cell wall polymer biosynthesis LytR-Cps2A-Psr (LCP) family protein